MSSNGSLAFSFESFMEGAYSPTGVPGHVLISSRPKAHVLGSEQMAMLLSLYLCQYRRTQDASCMAWSRCLYM